MPIYFGGDNLYNYLPENSFLYTNIHCSGEELEKEVKEAIEKINSSFREDHLEELNEARDLLLNKYQLWPYIYNAIQKI